MVLVDTSVAVKWFLEEEGSEEARDLLRREELGTLDLLLYELTNVLQLQSTLSPADIREFLTRLFQFQIQFFVLPEKSFLRVAELARKFQITSYDAGFLALAESLKTDFVTADLKLVRKVPYCKKLIA